MNVNNNMVRKRQTGGRDADSAAFGGTLSAASSPILQSGSLGGRTETDDTFDCVGLSRGNSCSDDQTHVVDGKCLSCSRRGRGDDDCRKQSSACSETLGLSSENNVEDLYDHEDVSPDRVSKSQAGCSAHDLHHSAAAASEREDSVSNDVPTLLLWILNVVLAPPDKFLHALAGLVGVGFVLFCLMVVIIWPHFFGVAEYVLSSLVFGNSYNMMVGSASSTLSSSALGSSSISSMSSVPAVVFCSTYVPDPALEGDNCRPCPAFGTCRRGSLVECEAPYRATTTRSGAACVEDDTVVRIAAAMAVELDAELALSRGLKDCDPEVNDFFARSEARDFLRLRMDALADPLADEGWRRTGFDDAAFEYLYTVEVENEERGSLVGLHGLGGHDITTSSTSARAKGVGQDLSSRKTASTSSSSTGLHSTSRKTNDEDGGGGPPRGSQGGTKIPTFSSSKSVFPPSLRRSGSLFFSTRKEPVLRCVLRNFFWQYVPPVLICGSLFAGVFLLLTHYARERQVRQVVVQAIELHTCVEPRLQGIYAEDLVEWTNLPEKRVLQILEDITSGGVSCQEETSSSTTGAGGHRQGSIKQSSCSTTHDNTINRKQPRRSSLSVLAQRAMSGLGCAAGGEADGAQQGEEYSVRRFYEDLLDDENQDDQGYQQGSTDPNDVAGKRGNHPQQERRTDWGVRRDPYRGFYYSQYVVDTVAPSKEDIRTAKNVQLC
ncbi:unnamed protein product [Amoebophrya sp. A25]|nr:unnamed protein product [Amoebophrya sp. A25]|eukprot:GSA25T00004507001.1